MDSYEALLIEAESHDYIVKEAPLYGGYKGCIKGKRIAIEQNLTSTEKACVLAEELVHREITGGNILDQSDANNRWQEQKARTLAAIRQVKLYQLADVLRDGYQSVSDMAERLEVTAEFLIDAITVYRRKYGTYVRVNGDILLLEPTVALLSQIH